MRVFFFKFNGTHKSMHKMIIYTLSNKFKLAANKKYTMQGGLHTNVRSNLWRTHTVIVYTLFNFIISKVSILYQNT